ncbi:hypothetical protein K4A07_16190, partial [Lactiplantibacillus plantarum]|nr:hypothetical protein [Lactiplantibacillus plantarum]
MKIQYVGAAFAALCVSGCVSSGSGDTILAIPREQAAAMSVGQIVLTGRPENVSADFEQVFATQVRQETDRCATGATPLRLEVRVTEFKKANPAMTFLVGDSNVIKGQAVLIDPATGRKVADFDITRSVGGGGLIAAAD